MIMEITNTLIDVLVCPISQEALYFNKATNELISQKARLAYPVINGIPFLLKDHAREIAENESLGKPFSNSIAPRKLSAWHDIID